MNKKYLEINSSYKKKLIFHVGCSAGFFSEYNNMVFAIAYCLKNKIQFQLFSKDANFGIDKGWTDFFEPFCIELHDNFHIALNRRQRYPNIKNIAKGIYRELKYKQESVPWLYDRFKPYMLFQYFKEQYFKRKYCFDYYTFELWNKFRKYDPYSNPNILNEFIQTDIYTGTFRKLFQDIIQFTWRYNAETKIEIENIIDLLKLPNKYIGMHIRGGDKINEDTVFSYTKYFDLLSNSNAYKDLNHIFLLTDDFSILEMAKNDYPQYTFYSFCKPDENGYDNSKFNGFSKTERKKRLSTLFGSIEILSNSELFIGVYNSNPGMYLDLRMNGNTLWVDRLVSNI